MSRGSPRLLSTGPDVQQRGAKDKEGMALGSEPTADVPAAADSPSLSREEGSRETGATGDELAEDPSIQPDASMRGRSDSLASSGAADHTSGKGEGKANDRRKDRGVLRSTQLEGRMKGGQENPVRKSTTSIVRIISSLRNGDHDRIRKKGLGTLPSNFRKTRTISREESQKGEENGASVLGDQEKSKLKSTSLQRRQDLERRRYEESVLARADEVHTKQEDFEKERKWKLSQAKKVAVRVSRSKLDTEAKDLRRIKEEEHRIRRVAGGIAKEVKKFWLKVEKLVLYKHHLNVEERRKKALDKHLDFLLGQTERYSTMLAENLTDNILSPMQNALPLSLEGAQIVDVTSEAPRTQSKQYLEQKRLSDMTVHALDQIDGRLDVADDDFYVGNEVNEEIGKTAVAADGAPIRNEERKELSSFRRESETSELRIKPEDDDSSNDISEKQRQERIPRGQENANENSTACFPSSLPAARPQETVDIDTEVKNSRQPSNVQKSGGVDARTESWDLHGRQRKDGVVPLGKRPVHPPNMLDESECIPSTLADVIEEGDEAKSRERNHVAKADTDGDFIESQSADHLSLAATDEDRDGERKVDRLDSVTNADPDRGSRADELEHPEASPVALGTGLRGKTNQDKVADAAAEAQSAQPTGHTFLTTKVRTKLPFLLKHSLREYQHIGLDWLVTMYDKRLNGILADEMGLGKTIMTISLLAHLACDRGIWGPHLIVVPTSVMLNWETEFMKWCPAFKILTYFGSVKERKYKRQGWSKLNSFHVCITTYRLVIQDAKAFRRKKWKYLILDEAHLIKNWKSQRWQTLLNFNSKRRILLTGTPLQNDLMELWSLMHFLMPHVFQSHQEFRDWFSNPITYMIEGQEMVNKEIVDRLHNVLRPFLLRRLKQDVEKQLPGKFEHVLRCRLSKRQRNLYEDFMAKSDTQMALASGNFLGLINVLMQLRKVCNHPDLFEGRPIMSSLDMPGLSLHLSSLACTALRLEPFSSVNLKDYNMLFGLASYDMKAWECEEVASISASTALIEEISSTGEDNWDAGDGSVQSGHGLIEELQAILRAKRANEKKEKIHALSWLNLLRCRKWPLCNVDLRNFLSLEDQVHDVHKIEAEAGRYFEFSSCVADMVKVPATRLEMVLDLVKSFVFTIHAAQAPAAAAWCSRPTSSNILLPTIYDGTLEKISASLEPLRPVLIRRQLFFPDRRLLQFDCGKLQELALLLRRLKSEGHRALIFTQMTKMLDILESFINLYGYTYMRLDGSTKPEQRQILMQRFNTDPKIFLFILSTRSGGVGVNLIGADTVIFYDSDWNPAMDQQAQDRCHRIGQTREVHIYRLVSERTIEENILTKANQKRVLDDLVIQSGSYNTEFFKKLDPIELFPGLAVVESGVATRPTENLPSQQPNEANNRSGNFSKADVEAALKNAEDEADYMAMKRVEQEVAAENQEFTEEGFSRNVEEEDLAEVVEEGTNLVGKDESNVMGSAAKEGTAEEGNMANAGEEVLQMDMALISTQEDEMDMLADVKQMAGTAGRGGESFEQRIRPIERYAIQFLELSDPRFNKASEAMVTFEEKEWELDQLEKLKEEQEAEIDEDNEPLFYESWDTAFANEAYRQQVEVLAQQQESQRLLEEEAAEEVADPGRIFVEASSSADSGQEAVRSNSLKRLKKTKFKSLKRGSLDPMDGPSSISPTREKDGSSLQPLHEIPPRPSHRSMASKLKHFRLIEKENVDGNAQRWERLMHQRSRWRRKLCYRMNPSLTSLLPVTNGLPSMSIHADCESLECQLPTSIDAMDMLQERASFTSFPVKSSNLILSEKDRMDIAKMYRITDRWSSAEDSVLCAVVHEYGGNWLLASDVLAGIPDGSVYRGRHRHPSSCKERLRQLLAQHASATIKGADSERGAHLKVTEEHTNRLLEVILGPTDSELLLQTHFAAVLAAAHNMFAKLRMEADGPVAQGSVATSRGAEPKVLEENLVGASSSSSSRQLVANALHDVDALQTSHSTGNLTIRPPVNENELDAERLNTSEDMQLDLRQLPFNQPSALSVLERIPEYVSVSNSLEPTSTVPGPFPGALRSFAEDNADQRFRSATSRGWGNGLYEWAAAGTSGLGSFIVHQRKAKKRPPPADPDKLPQSKHTSGSKAAPVSDVVNVPLTIKPSRKRESDSLATTPGWAEIENVARFINYPGPGVPASDTLMQPEPSQPGVQDDAAEVIPRQKTVTITPTRIEKEGRRPPSIALRGTKSSGVKASTPKKRLSAPGGTSERAPQLDG